jgi:hypothetical protein
MTSPGKPPAVLTLLFSLLSIRMKPNLPLRRPVFTVAVLLLFLFALLINIQQAHILAVAFS